MKRQATADLERLAELAEAAGVKVLRTRIPGEGEAVPAPPVAKVRPRYATPGSDGMNKTERRYADHLERLRLAGEIHRWDFEPEKFRLGNLGDKCYFSPDFRVLLNDGTVEFRDVKGGHMMEDALVKIKWFVREHPYPLVVVRWVKGQWSEERWEN